MIVRRVAILVALVAATASAQSVPDPPDAPAIVPIDGGLAFLAIAGVGYGVRRLWRRR